MTPKVRTSTYIAVGCIAALVVLSLAGAIMNVGDHLFGAHFVLGVIFYIIVVVLVIVGVVMPLIGIARRPVFSLYQLRESSGSAKKRNLCMLIDNLQGCGMLSADEAHELDGLVQAGEEVDDRVIALFEERVVPAIDDDTKKAATTAFFVAAVAHSPLISTMTMLSVCLDLVRAIVEHCGFRPTNLALGRLYLRVMVSALVVGGIEDADLSDMIGQALGGGMGARAGGFVIGSAADGFVSAFLVFRVGVITKNWLTSEEGARSMRSLRRASYKEALGLMREGDFMESVTATLKQTGSSVAEAVSTHVTETAQNMTASVTATAQNVTTNVTDRAKRGVDKARSLFKRDKEQ